MSAIGEVDERRRNAQDLGHWKEGASRYYLDRSFLDAQTYYELLVMNRTLQALLQGISKTRRVLDIDMGLPYTVGHRWKEFEGFEVVKMQRE
jgi:hypothetical protein